MSRNHIPPALQNAVLSYFRILSPHDSGLQFSAYSPMPVRRTETKSASPLPTSHSTDRLHNASGLRPLISSRSAYTIKYHEVLRPLHKYNECHSLPPAQYPYPGSAEEAADLPASDPEVRDPAIPERNSPFQNTPHIGTQSPLLPHIDRAPDIAAPLLQDRRLMQ